VQWRSLQERDSTPRDNPTDVVLRQADFAPTSPAGRAAAGDVGVQDFVQRMGSSGGTSTAMPVRIDDRTAAGLVRRRAITGCVFSVQIDCTDISQTV
jgi:hypothetical protein